MSAAVLREAAALMRARVGAIRESDPTDDWYSANPNTSLSKWAGVADVEHIASWHPAVAVAVADWLEMVASGVGASREWGQALAVATAYLGASA